jgi:hypothetical protein
MGEGGKEVREIEIHSNLTLSRTLRLIFSLYSFRLLTHAPAEDVGVMFGDLWIYSAATDTWEWKSGNREETPFYPNPLGAQWVIYSFFSLIQIYSFIINKAKQYLGTWNACRGNYVGQWFEFILVWRATSASTFSTLSAATRFVFIIIYPL